jgi:signal transduction histidine kinase
MQGWLGVRTLLRAAQEADTARWSATTDALTARARGAALGPGIPALTPTRYLSGTVGEWHPLAPGSAADAALGAALDRKLSRPFPEELSFDATVVTRATDTALVFFEPRLRGIGWVAVEVPLEDFRRQVFTSPLRYANASLGRAWDSAASRPAATPAIPFAIRIVNDDGTPLLTDGAPADRGWSGNGRIGGALAATITLQLQAPAIPRLLPSGYPPAPGARVAGAVAIALLLLGTTATAARRSLALARQREAFTSSVSHELRTPLTNIQLFAETLLLDRIRGEQERRDALETVTRETRRLVHMVENALAISRVGRPALRAVAREEPLAELIRNCLASFEPMFRARHVTTDVRVNVPPVTRIDAEALQRILVNLLDNAVRYGPDGQTIRLRVDQAPDRLELSVEDEGPGVPPEDRERIWQPFERGGSGGGGTGIGLAVVRQLVSLLGGDATVESGAVGARFVVRIPVGGAPEA